MIRSRNDFSPIGASTLGLDGNTERKRVPVPPTSRTALTSCITRPFNPSNDLSSGASFARYITALIPALHPALHHAVPIFQHGCQRLLDRKHRLPAGALTKLFCAAKDNLLV